jgi:chromosomal replication initiation ATPase DnaA
MTEEEIINKLSENERITMQCVCDTLSNYEGKTRTYLADFVASLCNVDRDKMFSESNCLDVAQARWLFWYAYRYMTNETYEKIGKLSGELYGKTFTKVGVAASVNKMYTLIEQQPIWRKRWTIIKRIIKLQNEVVFEPQVPITITIPKNVELTIKKE